MELFKLLKPQSIVVVGASERQGSFAGDTCKNMLTYTKALERVYFVNPKRTTVLDVPCYSGVSKIKDNIDLMVICTPMNTVVPLLKEGAAKGCRGAVVFASGYSETGREKGKLAEKELIEEAQKLGIAVMGPNCAGFANYIDEVQAFGLIAAKRDRKGKIGFVSQSGQFCQSFLDSPDLNFSYVISAGNGSVVKMEDYIDFLVDDPETKVVSIYIEGVKDTCKFASSLKKAAIGRKPVVILKAGKSEKGSVLAASHTGSLSGSDKCFDAVLKKYGAIRVDDMEELRKTSLLFEIMPALPKIATFASMNLSGGETGICADVGSIYGIRFPDFTQETIVSLKEQLPSYATPHNPLDMTATLSYNATLYANIFRTVMEDPNIGMVLIGYTLPEEITDPCITYMYEGIKNVLSEGNGKPAALIPFLENSRNQEYLNKFRSIGIPILPSAVYSFKILKYLTDFIDYDPSERTLELSLNNQMSTSYALSEYQSKQELKRYGLKVEEEYVAETVEDMYGYLDKIQFPIAMKIESADIFHKSDVGGVKLNIKSVEEAEAAFHGIVANVKEQRPDAKINGILLSSMMPKGVEFIVGIYNDPQFGLMLMAGMGGVMVELFMDTALYPVPLNKKEALKMLKGLRVYKMLLGYRGEPPCDSEALLDGIVSISKYAHENKEWIKEIDINPLFVYPQGNGIGVADALVVKYKQ